MVKCWEDHKDAGWAMVYYIVVWILGSEDGDLYCVRLDSDGECLIEAPELCCYIQNMVEENVGYQNYDVFIINILYPLG